MSAHSSLPAAVLWDFDGTLVDTEPYWFSAEYRLAEELGGAWNDDHAHHLIGSDLIAATTYLLQVVGRDDVDPKRLVHRLVDLARTAMATNGIIWRPGARDLLAEMRQRQIPTALVSMSYRSILDAGLQLLPPDSFDAVISGDAVPRGKPHPDPYLIAARELGVDASDCFVIEDSPTGAAAGTAAGSVVFGVRNIVDIPAAPRRVLLDGLAGMTVDQMCTLAAGVDAAGTETMS